jgi:TonB-dependent SusC/RagA subfamily outer membrane receptor
MKLITLLAVSFSILLSSCATTDKSKTSSEKDYKTIELADNEVTPENNLEAYLNRVAGVVVNGSGQNATVQVRGINSLSANTEPLFILNGTDIGSNYASAASSVRGLKISSVRVMKDSDATLYGVRGAGGVIVITAK